MQPKSSSFLILYGENAMASIVLGKKQVKIIFFVFLHNNIHCGYRNSPSIRTPYLCSKL